MNGVSSLSLFYGFCNPPSHDTFPLNDTFQENRGYLAGVSFAVIVALILGWFLHRTESELSSSFHSFPLPCSLVNSILCNVLQT